MKIEKLEDRPGHWSDCAIFNDAERGPCDCGGLNLAAYDSYRAITSLIPTPGSLARFIKDGILPSLVEAEESPVRRVTASASPANLEGSHDGITGCAGSDSMDLNDAGVSSVGDAKALTSTQSLTGNVPPHKQLPPLIDGSDNKGGSQ